MIGRDYTGDIAQLVLPHFVFCLKKDAWAYTTSNRVRKKDGAPSCLLATCSLDYSLEEKGADTQDSPAN